MRQQCSQALSMRIPLLVLYLTDSHEELGCCVLYLTGWHSWSQRDLTFLWYTGRQKATAKMCIQGRMLWCQARSYASIETNKPAHIIFCILSTPNITCSKVHNRIQCENQQQAINTSTGKQSVLPTQLQSVQLKAQTESQ